MPWVGRTMDSRARRVIRALRKAQELASPWEVYGEPVVRRDGAVVCRERGAELGTVVRHGDAAARLDAAWLAFEPGEHEEGEAHRTRREAARWLLERQVRRVRR